jgi:hypothetical protein
MDVTVRRIQVFLVATLMVGALPAPAHAASGGNTYVQNYLPAAGYPRECGRHEWNGNATGNEVWTKATRGGSSVPNCHPGPAPFTNGRPQGWLTIDLNVYGGSTPCYSSATSNSAGSSQASLVNSTCAYSNNTRRTSGSGYYLSTAGFYSFNYKENW